MAGRKSDFTLTLLCYRRACLLTAVLSLQEKASYQIGRRSHNSGTEDNLNGSHLFPEPAKQKQTSCKKNQLHDFQIFCLKTR